VIGVPGNVRVYLACGVTDMRKGFDGLAARVQTVLQLDPHGGALFVFRGRRGDLLKMLWWDGQGVPVRQAAGARPVSVATGEGRLGGADAGAVVDAARGDRLAGTATKLGAGSGGLSGAA
jgi:hypothetical protein